jgi:hypothetical protein
VWRAFANGVVWCGLALALWAQQERYAAAFLEIPLGARALGMGTAFTAVATDGTAFYWNPAGVGLLQEALLSGMYSAQYGSPTSPLAHFFFTGVVLPVSGLRVGVNWERFTVPDLRRYPDLTRVLSPQEREELVRRAEQGEFIPNADDAVWLTLARLIVLPLDFGWMRFTVPLELPVGVNVRLLRQLLRGGTGLPTAPGYHEVWWDGTDDDGQPVANGVYFYRIRVRAGDTVIERRGSVARVR